MIPSDLEEASIPDQVFLVDGASNTFAKLKGSWKKKFGLIILLFDYVMGY